MKEKKKRRETRSSYNKTPPAGYPGRNYDTRGRVFVNVEERARRGEFAKGVGKKPKVSVGYTYVCRPRVQCIQIARKRVGPAVGYIYIYIGDG